MTAPTQVVYRAWRDGGEVIALFPGLPEGRGRVLSYMQIGQHGEADYSHVISRTRPATQAEAAPLHLELEGLGYTLARRRRASR